MISDTKTKMISLPTTSTSLPRLAKNFLQKSEEQQSKASISGENKRIESNIAQNMQIKLNFPKFIECLVRLAKASVDFPQRLPDLIAAFLDKVMI